MNILLIITLAMDIVAAGAGMFYTWLMSDILKSLWKMKIDKIMHRKTKQELQDDIEELTGIGK